MFFDAEVYVAFVKTCRSAGITVPILPGIMCFNTLQGFKRMVAFCRTRVPEKLWMDMMALSKSDDDEVRRYGIDFGVRLGQELLRAGSSGLHFYCLNLSRVALGIVSGLGLGSQSVDATYTNEKVEFETEKAMNGSDKVKSKEKALSNHDHVGAVASS
jgi:methylenetetrahydrofolate reductase (NADPH)